MNRFIKWLQHRDYRIFYWFNHHMSRPTLDWLLYRITFLGGATFTILTTLLMAIWAPKPWGTVALQSAIALAVSHIPVAIMKWTLRRKRPYMKWPDTIVGPNPLRDPSFPSGHTTAIFAVVMPFIIFSPWLAFILLPIALTVTLSRIYLGLHYPSDCLAGAIFGIAAASVTVGFFDLTV